MLDADGDALNLSQVRTIYRTEFDDKTEVRATIANQATTLARFRGDDHEAEAKLFISNLVDLLNEGD